MRLASDTSIVPHPRPLQPLADAPRLSLQKPYANIVWHLKSDDLAASFTLQVFGEDFVRFTFLHPVPWQASCTPIELAGNASAYIEWLGVKPGKKGVTSLPAFFANELFTHRPMVMFQDIVLGSAFKRLSSTGGEAIANDWLHKAFNRGLLENLDDWATKMEAQLPLAEVDAAIKTAFVGDARLIEMMAFLAHQFDVPELLFRRICSAPNWAARLWQMTKGSHEKLLPWLLEVVSQQTDLSNLSATVLLQTLGVGKGLSRHLRNMTRAALETFSEVTDGFRNPVLIHAFFRRLGAALGRANNHDVDRIAGRRAQLLIKTCERLAIFDRYRATGIDYLDSRGLSAFFNLDTCLRGFETRPHIQGDNPIAIQSLTHLFEAVISAVLTAKVMGDFNRLRLENILSHIHDWLRVVGTPTRIEPNTTLGRLNERADLFFAVQQFEYMPKLAWECALIKDAGIWQEAVAGLNSPFQVLSLNTSELLWAESQYMKHCAASAYLEPTAAGATRLFSVKQEGLRVATVELKWTGRQWIVEQVKGRFNAALEAHLKTRSDLGRLLRALAAFYNQAASEPFPSVREIPRFLRADTPPLFHL